MKTNLKNFLKHAKTNNLTIVLLTMVFFLTSIFSLGKSIHISDDQYSTYSMIISNSFNEFDVVYTEDHTVYSNLENNNITEAFDVEAFSAIDSNLAKFWYPHYLATVVLAVDRDIVDKEVLGWNDLYSSGYEVGFLDAFQNLEIQISAIAYGLEGKNYSLNKVTDLLSHLNKNNLLKINSSSSPITICFDYQAVALKTMSKNLEIIIPNEGSLTFQKGLLSNEKLEISQDIDKLLLENKLVPLSGNRNEELYPKKTEYTRAKRVVDIDHFNKVSQTIKRVVERRVLNNKPFTSIDNFEHLMFALLYLVIVTIWTASVYHRSTQKGIKYAALILGVTLNNWTLVRLVKYQVIGLPSLSRYLWYSYYIFQLTIPLIILWMSWAIDKPKDIIFPPKWWKIIASISFLLVVLVFTNDLHKKVFILDLTRTDWDINYAYGVGYFIVLAFGMGNIFLAFLIQVVKSVNNPQKQGFIFPLFIFILFGIYTYMYIMRQPLVYQTDITIITGLFAMVMFESCIHCGLIPVNSKYIELFKKSPVKLHIFDDNKDLVFYSQPSSAVEKEMVNKLLRSNLNPVINSDTLILANKIPGGFAVWYEDIKKINELFNEIIEKSDRLKETNILLKKEKNLLKNLNEQLAKKELNEEFEKEIAQSINNLSKMVDNLDENKRDKKALTLVALLVTYIKRRSNLFFLEKQKDYVNVKKLTNYIAELSNISSLTSTQVATLSEGAEEISIRYVTLFYEFFYQILIHSIKKESTYLINYFEVDDKSYTMRLLPSKNPEMIKFEDKTVKLIEKSNGLIVIKDVEDSKGIMLSFKKGGTKDD